jgi:hypothetical protein
MKKHMSIEIEMLHRTRIECFSKAILQLEQGINNSCADRRQKNHLKTNKYYPFKPSEA